MASIRSSWKKGAKLMGTEEHRATAPKRLDIGILSISTTRTLAEDKSGHWIHRQAQKEGHQVVYHQVIPDDEQIISTTISEVIREHHPHALLLTGGTGASPKDVTIEAVRPLFSKELSAFGVLFTQLSFEEIDAAALLSRATAGVIDNVAVFCMPGSLNACKLACKALIFPELGHLIRHIQER
jgi:molybdenum cofactor biosynthesis protein B